MNREAGELTRMARELVSGLYDSVSSSLPDEIADQFAKYVLARFPGIPQVSRTKVVTRGDKVLISGVITKTPHAISSPRKEGHPISITVEFSKEDDETRPRRSGPCEKGRADIQIWIDQTLVERNASISRSGDDVEKWLLDVSSWMNHLIYVASESVR